MSETTNGCTCGDPFNWRDGCPIHSSGTPATAEREPVTRSRRNVDAQERVVAALWAFAHAQQTRPHTTTYENGPSANGPAVEEALEEIMGAFGYTVTPL